VTRLDRRRLETANAAFPSGERRARVRRGSRPASGLSVLAGAMGGFEGCQKAYHVRGDSRESMMAERKEFQGAVWKGRGEL
jgi:hypothetical protein